MKDCVFCPKSGMELLCENELAKAFYDNYPVNEGHTLVVPKRHIATYFEASSDELIAINDLIFEVKKIIDQEFRPDGYNVGVNIGEAGGQTIFHLHVHVIPRYLGDVENPKGGVRRIKKSVVPYTKEENTNELFYYKLVRDRIPEIIENSGKHAVCRRAENEEYNKLLKAKLWEEVREYAESDGLEELADIFEVLKALAADHGVNWDEIVNMANKKAEKRGGFGERWVLEKVIE